MLDLTAQLRDELDRALCGPVGTLLGLDLADMTRDRLRERVPMLAHQLTVEDDDRLVAETVIDIMCALWPRSDPDPDWWRSPLGLACARSLGHDDAEAVSRSVAAAMLGVHTGTVDTLLHRGTLDRHPDGGVLRASVLRRIVRLHG